MNSASYRTYRLSRGLIQMQYKKWTFCLKSSLDAVRLAAGQTLYRLMNNRLGTLQMMWSINPGSEGLTDHSTRWLMLYHSRTCLSQRDSSGDMGAVEGTWQ